MAMHSLRATAFRGDPDLAELHAFFQPERQFAGDTLWSFGTSLKSAYVNTFEFLNHAPVVELWRDAGDAVQAVSRLSLGTGEWFHLAAPGYRDAEIAASLIRQADSAFVLLTDLESWSTVRYESATEDIEQLHGASYVADGIAEVYMTCSLGEPTETVPAPTGVQFHELDRSNSDLIQERAVAQVDAFSNGAPSEGHLAWITRSLPHLLHYGYPANNPNLIAVDDDGQILAFADMFLDRINLIGEFEPVGTRMSARRRGLSRAIMTQGLTEMREAGMTQAVVRTGYDNTAAIAAYKSVGFETTDHLVRYRKRR